MFDTLLKGNSFIFGEDVPEKISSVPDSIMTYENSFLIYRDIGAKDKASRIALDLRE